MQLIQPGTILDVVPGSDLHLKYYLPDRLYGRIIGPIMTIWVLDDASRFMVDLFQ